MSNQPEASNDRRRDPEIADEFTERVLMSLVFDVTQLAENVERVRIQITTLAKERGVPVRE